jgi:hypothetical protein
MYTVRFSSRKSLYTLEKVRQIIELPLIKRLAFPAQVWINENVAHHYQSPTEFDTMTHLRTYYQENPDSENYLTWRFEFAQDEIIRMGITLNKVIDVTPSVVWIKITPDEIASGKFHLAMFKELVVQTIPIFSAEQAVFYHSEMARYRNPLPKGRTSNGLDFILEIGWASFFGEDLINDLGYARFDNLTTCFRKERLLKGMLVVLQEEPFDAHNEEHRKREQQALEELGLLEMKRLGI